MLLEMVCGYLTGEESLMLKHKMQERGNIKLIKSKKKMVLSKQACIKMLTKYAVPKEFVYGKRQAMNISKVYSESDETIQHTVMKPTWE